MPCSSFRTHLCESLVQFCFESMDSLLAPLFLAQGNSTRSTFCLLNIELGLAFMARLKTVG